MLFSIHFYKVMISRSRKTNCFRIGWKTSYVHVLIFSNLLLPSAGVVLLVLYPIIFSSFILQKIEYKIGEWHYLMETLHSKHFQLFKGLFF